MNYVSNLRKSFFSFHALFWGLPKYYWLHFFSLTAHNYAGSIWTRNKPVFVIAPVDLPIISRVSSGHLPQLLQLNFKLEIIFGTFVADLGVKPQQVFGLHDVHQALSVGSKLVRLLGHRDEVANEEFQNQFLLGVVERSDNFFAQVDRISLKRILLFNCLFVLAFIFLCNSTSSFVHLFLVLVLRFGFLLIERFAARPISSNSLQVSMYVLNLFIFIGFKIKAENGCH